MSGSDENQRYEKVREVAQGSSSAIFKSYDHALLRDVAMKVLDPRAKEFEEELERFREEAQVTAQLEHPNIVPVYDWYLDDDDNMCFIMQYVRGGTLRDHLQEEHYDPSVEADLYKFLQIFLKVCEALAFAHSKGVVHRDLKPDNIMVGTHGQVYLLDWGILRLIAPEKLSIPLSKMPDPINIHRDPTKMDLDLPGMVLGTLSYLSPEQARGELDTIDERTDVFALGAILYEILTQSPPYFAWTPEEFVELAKACDIQHPQEKLSDVHLPSELCRIAMKAMAAVKEDRYQSVEELKADLEKFLQGGGRFTKRYYKEGDYIVIEGDEANHAFMIVRGHCEVSKRVDGVEQHLVTMGPGEVFGETAVFVSGLRTATVKAVDDVTVKVIDREALEQEVGFDSWVGTIIRNLIERFINMDAVRSKRQKTMQNSSLLNLILLHAAQHGSTIQPGSMQTDREPLMDYLMEETSQSSDDLLSRLQQTSGISFDAKHVTLDLVALRLGINES